MKERIRTRPS